MVIWVINKQWCPSFMNALISFVIYEAQTVHFFTEFSGKVDPKTPSLKEQTLHTENKLISAWRFILGSKDLSIAQPAMEY